MKKILFVFLFAGIYTAGDIFAQEVSSAKHELRGVVCDQTGAVVPLLPLQFKSAMTQDYALTDINGEFRVVLFSDGDFVLTAEPLSPDKFKVFIRLSANGLNPGYLELAIDSDAIVCSGNRGNASPKVITSAEPPFPSAARAVRAGGDVSVIVKIAPDGKVSSAKAVSGHPLLRHASEVAAEKFVFESADGVVEREVVLTFVFLDQSEKPGLKRYKCPYRIVVVGKAMIY